MITNLDEVASAAATAQDEGRLRALVAAGGDGTLAELVNRSTADTPLAVFPLGTANLLANYLGLRRRLKLSPTCSLRDVPCGLMREGRHGFLVNRRKSTGQGRGAQRWGRQSLCKASRANAPQNRPSSRIFMTVAGVGFDATVVEQLHRGRTGNIRFWSYAKPIVESLRSYSYPTLRYECALAATVPIETAPIETVPIDAGPTKVGPFEVGGIRPHGFDAKWLFIQNLPCYAGGLNFAPRACGTDGLLDMCAFKARFTRAGFEVCELRLVESARASGRLPDDAD